MIDPKTLVTHFSELGMDTYFGVPDSLLKDFCAYISDHADTGKHVITANEGNAVAMAAGYHMATGKRAIVYLQNSGLGNIINPITSIADKEVYQIPMLLLVGWRGEPEIKDEPQHIKQGRITPAQLDVLEIPYKILDSDSDPGQLAHWSNEQMNHHSAPVALLVRKNTFTSYKNQNKSLTSFSLQREQALSILLNLAGDAAIISTTGKTSREVFEVRTAHNMIQRDFLTVGGMGHTSSIALGVALGNPNKSIVCLDGDGSLLMHMGAMAIIGSLSPLRFIHVLLNNASHESVGGQPTAADQIDFKAIALACGYKAYARATTEHELQTAWTQLQGLAGPVMLEVCIAIGSRDNLGRPTSAPPQNKRSFMDWVAQQ